MFQETKKKSFCSMQTYSKNVYCDIQITKVLQDFKNLGEKQ